jgi:hypothetical protein
MEERQFHTLELVANHRPAPLFLQILWTGCPEKEMAV